MKLEITEKDDPEFAHYMIDCMDHYKKTYVKNSNPNDDLLTKRECSVCKQIKVTNLIRGRFVCDKCKSEGKHSNYNKSETNGN